MNQNATKTPTIESHRERLTGIVRELIEPTAFGDTNGQCHRAMDTLGALPLATEPYNLATNRLKNARYYPETGEFGAAQFELRQLLSSIDRL